MVGTRRNIKTRLVASMLLILSILVFVVSSGALAYFTDRVFSSASAKVGDLDLVFNDISSSVTGDNEILSPNEFAQDRSWETSIVSDGAIINPGDYFDVSYELLNLGSKSIDIHQQITVTSTMPLTPGKEEYTLTILGGNDTATPVEGTLAAGGYSIVYDLKDITLDGSDEKEDCSTNGKYIIRLDFNELAGNEFQGTGLGIRVDAQAKQHRNTSDVDWVDWESYETKVEQVV